MKTNYLIPKPTPAPRHPLRKTTRFAVYLTADGRPLKWSGNFPLPAIGSRVYIRLNGIGWAVVHGYFESDGWLGVMTKVTDPPEWLDKQQREDQNRPLTGWMKEGLGCEFGAELRLTGPPDPEPRRKLPHPPAAPKPPRLFYIAANSREGCGHEHRLAHEAELCRDRMNRTAIAYSQRPSFKVYECRWELLGDGRRVRTCLLPKGDNR